MTAPRFDALAGRLLERAGSGRIDGPLPADRARAIALIEGAIRRKNRRRLAARLTFAAAAAVLLGLGASQLVLHLETPPVALSKPVAASPAITVVGHPTGGGASIVETGAIGPLTDGKPLAAGSRIVAEPDGHVVLSISTGTRLTVEENGDLSIVESGSSEIFALRSGALRADVAKLHAGQRFIVRTPDAEIEVRGTSFHVAMVDADPACEHGATTRVNVYEGVVTVRHAGQEERVAADQHWPSSCDAKEVLAARPAKARAVQGHQAEPASPAPDPEQTASDLGEQNDFFARAFAAKRRGAAREAIEGFEAFVARYPSSSLVESALAQRMQLLRGVDRGRAAAAARQYLSRYPHGFARDQAEAIEQDAP
jgi:hypothetical protein